MHFLRYAIFLVVLIAAGFLVASPQAASKQAAATAAVALVNVEGEAEEADDADEDDDADEEEPEAVEHFEDPADILQYYPEFEVASRIEVLEDDYMIYPCFDCHDNDTQLANPRVRELEEEHDLIRLDHGKGRFWCMTCHSLKNRDTLISLDQKPISFDESHLLCGQCHFNRQRDFFLGGHGKRVGGWQGEKELMACVECHNPHSPAIDKREPLAAPTLRPGLPQEDVVRHHPKKPWEKIAADRGLSGKQQDGEH